MAANPLIALQARAPDIGRAIQPGIQMIQDRPINKLNTDIARERLSQLKEDREARSIAIGAATFLPRIQQGDIQGTITALEDRVQEIQSRGGNPRDTLEVLQQLRTGDVQGATQNLQRAVQMGRMAGILTKPDTLSGSDLVQVNIDGKSVYVPADQAVGFEAAPKDVQPSEIQKLIAARNALPQGSPDRAALDARIAKLSQSDQGITIGPDGTIQIGGPAGRAPTKDLSRADAKTIEKSREAAAAAESSELLINRAKELLADPELETGKFTQLSKTFNQLTAAFGSEAGEKQAAKLEELDSISKNMGAEALKLFGGSDTERELLVAIETGIELGKTKKANLNILRRKGEAIEILMQKPDFEAQWIQKNGSLVNPDADTGEYFRKAWRRFQRESFGEAEPSANSGSDDPLGIL